MLAVSSYKPDYIKACRARVERQLSGWKKMAMAAPSEAAAFAPGYFNNMVLALDHYFLHRQRSNEGKDGAPCNEVRMLCDSIKENGGVLARNSTIKFDPAKSATGLRIGDTIALDAKSFGALADAFFEDIAKRYP